MSAVIKNAVPPPAPGPRSMSPPPSASINHVIASCLVFLFQNADNVHDLENCAMNSTSSQWRDFSLPKLPPAWPFDINTVNALLNCTQHHPATDDIPTTVIFAILTVSVLGVFRAMHLLPCTFSVDWLSAKCARTMQKSANVFIALCMLTAPLCIMGQVSSLSSINR